MMMMMMMPLQVQAALLKDTTSGGLATKVVALGIGPHFHLSELQVIASPPLNRTVILVKDFSSLTTVEEQLRIEMCSGK